MLFSTHDIYGLLDCNNFYASCERVFQPGLIDKPVVILSNNDGCVIARSNEAKALGIGMGEPVFKCEYILKNFQVARRSANFPLYADMSQRVMAILRQEIPEIEIYSIDEAFFKLSFQEKSKSKERIENAYHLAKKIRQKILRWTGIPVSIGLAPSKTLAKLANKIAKQETGVFCLGFNSSDDKHLAGIGVEEIWGVGKAYSKHLQKVGILSALDFKNADESWVQKLMKINGLRTLNELRGVACLTLTEDFKPRKSILSSRSFGQKIEDLETIKSAVARFVSTAAEKLRAENQLAAKIGVFMKDSNFDSLYGEKVLLQPSAYTPDLIKASHQICHEIFRPGKYKKAGVVFSTLIADDSLQINLRHCNFESPEQHMEKVNKQQKVSKTIDALNDYFGSRTVFWAASGSPKANTSAWSAWAPQQEHRSPCFTTKWTDIPKLN